MLPCIRTIKLRSAPAARFPTLDGVDGVRTRSLTSVCLYRTHTVFVMAHSKCRMCSFMPGRRYWWGAMAFSTETRAYYWYPAPRGSRTITSTWFSAVYRCCDGNRLCLYGVDGGATRDFICLPKRLTGCIGIFVVCVCFGLNLAKAEKHRRIPKLI